MTEDSLAASGQPMPRVQHDVVIVACAGNRGRPGASTIVWYPARAPGVIAVGGLAPDRAAWPGSLVGPPIALVAPADDLVAARRGGYWRVAGTSFATAL